jgi:hypothetical protein
MLSQAEENVLKQLAREKTPTVVMNPNGGGTNDTAEATARHVASLVGRTLGVAPVVVGGQIGGASHLQAAMDDSEFRKRVKHVLLKDEPTTAFIARTGLGYSQVFAMTKDEITKFVKQAEINNNDGIRAPRLHGGNSWSYDPPIEAGK